MPALEEGAKCHINMKILLFTWSFGALSLAYELQAAAKSACFEALTPAAVSTISSPTPTLGYSG